MATVYAEVTNDTDIKAEIQTAGADMTAAVRRLAELSTADKPCMIATLEALSAIGGPLFDLVHDMLGDGAAYLEAEGYEDEAERLGYAETAISVAIDDLRIARDHLRKN